MLLVKYLVSAALAFIQRLHRRHIVFKLLVYKWAAHLNDPARKLSAFKIFIPCITVYIIKRVKDFVLRQQITYIRVK